ncbi:MAG: amidohydrolase/deacetylase family metallohydrolase [Bryobacterales bacterium]|nr:amidohydrolase/deacetylase family metallohydrolase [Bryobacteraceae bacterium]MDW8355500.1 amidohydrolase/deacetylase family metallohydrolase [Bryobacterales bacterium]
MGIHPRDGVSRKSRRTTLAGLLAVAVLGAQPYDLVLQGGHVIDPKNQIDGVRDVAIAGGKIARIAERIPASEARQRINVQGLYVTPGLIDMHVHVYLITGQKGLVGEVSVLPDAFSFRSGVTTMVDAGTAGWRNFGDFRQRIIDRARTRVLAFLNIGGVGMSSEGENDVRDMDPEQAARTARAHRDVIVGFKVAHYDKDEWPDVDNALAAGRATGLPVMVDFGWTGQQRTLETLLTGKLRPGDIYTHCYSGHRAELLADNRLNPAMWEGRKRGILFDVGHGAASFYWNIAVPAVEQGFYPDVISTDLHGGSMNAGMKDMLNVMSKMLALGIPLADVIRMSTWAPAQAIRRPELGHLDPGAVADVAVLRLERGSFGFLDAAGARHPGDRRLVAELTIRGGSIVWDLNGLAAADWKTFPYRPRQRPK